MTDDKNICIPSSILRTARLSIPDHVRAAAVVIVFEKDVAVTLQDEGIGREKMAVL